MRVLESHIEYIDLLRRGWALISELEMYGQTKSYFQHEFYPYLRFTLAEAREFEIKLGTPCEDCFKLCHQRCKIR
jgi:hypothetical protein